MSPELSKSSISSSGLWNTCGNKSPVEKLRVSETGGYSAHPAVQSDGSEWAGRQPLVTDASAEAHAHLNQKQTADVFRSKLRVPSAFSYSF